MGEIIGVSETKSKEHGCRKTVLIRGVTKRRGKLLWENFKLVNAISCAL